MAQIAAGPSGEIGRLRERSLLRMSAYVGGQWIEADAGGSFAVLDPASGEELARVIVDFIRQTAG